MAARGTAQRPNGAVQGKICQFKLVLLGKNYFDTVWCQRVIGSAKNSTWFTCDIYLAYCCNGQF